MPIVWTMPDGSIQVTTLVDSFLERERRPGEDTTTAVLRLANHIQSKTPGLQAGVAALVASKDVPSTRSERDKWRVMDGKVQVDPSVPDKVRG